MTHATAEPMCGQNSRTVSRRGLSVPCCSEPPARIFQRVVYGTPERAANALSSAKESVCSEARTSAAEGSDVFIPPIVSTSECLVNAIRNSLKSHFRPNVPLMVQKPEQILWTNISTLMVARWGRENTNRLAREAGIGLATANRLKKQESITRLDMVAKVADLFAVQPWQLLKPPGEQPLTISPSGREVLEWFEAMSDDPAAQERAYGLIYSVCVKRRWPGPALAQPASEPIPQPQKARQTPRG